MNISEQIPKPSIVNYSDYRQFIFDVINYRKKLNSNFSYQYCAKKLKTGISYLKLIANQKRHASLDRLSSIASFFELTTQETFCFIVMFLENTSQEKYLTDYFKNIRKSIQADISTQYQLRTDIINKNIDRDLINDYLKRIIIGISRFPNFKIDAHWINERLFDKSYSLDEIDQAVKELISEKILTENNHNIHHNYQTLDHFNPVRELTFKHHVDYMISKLENRSNFKPYSYFNMDIAISNEKKKLLFDKIIEFQNYLMQLEEESPTADSVHVINFGFFTIAESDDSTKS